MSLLVRRSLKVLHELGGIGLLGAITAWLVLLGTAHARGPEVVVLRLGLLQVGKLMLLPALALCLISGLLAIAATPAYLDAGWAWIKALLGLSMFEASLMLTGRAGEALELARRSGSAAALGRPEWGELWLLLAVSVANVVLGVWRPRLMRRDKRHGRERSAPGAPSAPPVSESASAAGPSAPS